MSWTWLARDGAGESRSCGDLVAGSSCLLDGCVGHRGERGREVALANGARSPATPTVLMLTNSRMPNRPSSRPCPERSIPLNGSRGSERSIALMNTHPTSSDLASSRAAFAAAVHKLAASAGPAARMACQNGKFHGMTANKHAEGFVAYRQVVHVARHTPRRHAAHARGRRAVGVTNARTPRGNESAVPSHRWVRVRRGRRAVRPWWG